MSQKRKPESRVRIFLCTLLRPKSEIGDRDRDRQPALYSDGSRVEDQIYALSRAKARYQFYQRLREVADHIRFQDIRVSGSADPSIARAQRVRRIGTHRGLPFARIGMRVEVDGRAGVLVDGNDSGNFDVLFVDTGVVMNCHPWWRMKYFDANGQEIEHVAVAC